MKWQLQHKNRYFSKIHGFKIVKQEITIIIVLFEKNNGFYAVVAISQNFTKLAYRAFILEFFQKKRKYWCLDFTDCTSTMYTKNLY